MRVIARSILLKFVASLAGHQDQPAVKAALDAWFDEVSKAEWKTTADVKRRYVTASIVTAERIVFNIKGNDYRLVVSADFGKAIVWINGSARTRTTTRSTSPRCSMTNDLKPIRSEADNEAAIAEVQRLWGAKDGTPEGDQLDLLATLIDAYEARLPDRSARPHRRDPISDGAARPDTEGSRTVYRHACTRRGSHEQLTRPVDRYDPPSSSRTWHLGRGADPSDAG
jgi:mRNA interferase HigB